LLTTILKAIIAIGVVFPLINKWIEELSFMYVTSKIANIKKEYRDALKKAIDLQDQRDLEKAIGSDLAGKPSGVPGSSIVDDLPGVQKLN
jgi:hypothetical protein